MGSARQTAQEVPDMPLASAHVFKVLPANLQRDPEVVESVKKMKPKQFHKKIAKEHPSVHIEEQEDLRRGCGFALRRPCTRAVTVL